MEPILPYDCGICFGDFRLPVKVLNCGHSFCGPCLTPVGGQGQVQCPICQYVTFLTVHGVAGLTNNLTVHTMIRKTRPANKILIDYSLLGPPPKAPNVYNGSSSALPTITRQSSFLMSPIPSTHGSSSSLFDSRPSTPMVQPSSPALMMPPLLPQGFLLPVEYNNNHGLSPNKLINLPSKSYIRQVDQGATIVVGDQSYVVTGENCTLITGGECKIFSNQPMLPTVSNQAQIIQGYSKVQIGHQSQVQIGKDCALTVGNHCEIWLGHGSTLMSAGPNCVLHTAVQDQKYG